MGFVFESEAVDAILRRFTIHENVIRPRDVDIEYTFEEGAAISFLCDDYGYLHERWETYDPTTGGVTLYSNSGEVIARADKMEPHIQAELYKILAEKPMSEGYERQYDKIAREEWIKTLKTAGVCLLIICMMFVMSGMVHEACKQRDAAIAERDALQQQLDFHTCRVQLEPMPVPEQTNQSPTLIEEPVPLTEEEFSDLQERLKKRKVDD